LHRIESGRLGFLERIPSLGAPLCDQHALVPEGRRPFTGMTVLENLELGAYRAAKAQRAGPAARVCAVSVLHEKPRPTGNAVRRQQQMLAIGGR
jgi:branched-chain amino acid transport system ATP-binding protein